jgi:tetratricopeptide (TPR) repeat protein
MRPALCLVALCILTFGLAADAFALEDVILADGSVRRAEILEVFDDGIQVKFTPKGGGTAEMKVPAARLDPHFFYGLADKAAGDDAKRHLKLGLWAYENGLFSRAKIQVERATALDPQLVKDIQDGKLPEIREGIAERVLQSAEKDIEKGNFDDAEKKLEALLARMPDTAAGTHARDIYKDLQTRKDEYEAKQEEEKLARLDEEKQKQEKELRRKTDPIKKDLTKAKDDLEAGLVEDSESKALKLLQSAITKGAAGLKKLEKLLVEFADDQDLVTRGNEVKAKVVAGMVNAYVQRADIYVWRGSTKNAEKELQKARELDPGNPDIEAAAQRIADRDNQDALELGWQRNRREGMRFRSGSVVRGGFGGGGFGGGGRRR